MGPVVAPLEDDLVASRRHDREESVAVDGAERRGGPERRRYRPEPRAGELERLDQRHQAHDDDDDQRGLEQPRRPAAPRWCGLGRRVGTGQASRECYRRPRRPGLTPPPWPHPVVQEQEAEGDRQQVEEAVVAGDGDQPLQAHQRPGGREPHPPRGQDQERDQALGREHQRRRPLLEPRRQVVRVPRGPRRQALGLIVVLERGQVPPGGVAAAELGQRRSDHEAEQQPAQRRQRQARGRRVAPRARACAPGRQEDGEEAGFEQQPVPLEPEEVLADDVEREVERPAGDERSGRRHAGRHQRRGEHARAAQRVERAVAGAEPGHRRQVPEADRPVVLRHGREGIARRQDAALPDQAQDLRPQRDERDQIDRPQRAHEDPRGEALARRDQVRAPEGPSPPVEARAVGGHLPVGPL